MFDAYRNRMAARGKNMSEMLRMQSNMVIEETWTRDPNYRQVYVVKVNSGLPEVTVEHELIDVKFNIKTYQAITSDEVAYMLQFRHGEEKRHPEIGIGSYVYMEDEDGEWKWWLLCHLDERPQFRQYQILECNWTFKWVFNSKIYEHLGVQRIQQSYNSGQWSGDRIDFVDNITSAWLVTNDDTLTIGYDTKFLISDPKRRPAISWAVSKIEDTQPIGLTKIKLTQEPYTATIDNVEQMVADYWKSAIEPTISDSNTELKQTAAITFNGVAATVKVGGSYKVFTPVFSNESVTVKKWTISDENGDISADTTNYIIKQDGQQLKLKVAPNYSLIKKVLIVQVIGSDDSTAELKIEVV